MSTLAERIAAKKAAEAAAKGGVANATTPESPTKAVSTTEAGRVDTVVSSSESTSVVAVPATAEVQLATVTTVKTRPRTQAEAEAQAKAEVVQTDASGKPLSGFALMQARKKRIAELLLVPVVEGIEHGQQAGNQSNASGSGIAEQNVAGGTAASTGGNGSVAGQSPTQAEAPSVSASQEQSSAATEAREEDEAYAAATPEARQAYADIKPRLDALVTMSGEDLKSSMQELKTALMKNPNAVQLMLPSDIGQMVIALRKMTGVELAAKAAGKSTGTKGKKKEVALTAEELDKAWEEL